MADQPSDRFGPCVFEVARSDEEALFPQRVGAEVEFTQDDDGVMQIVRIEGHFIATDVTDEITEVHRVRREDAVKAINFLVRNQIDANWGDWSDKVADWFREQRGE
jgi:hypothetical protein